MKNDRHQRDQEQHLALLIDLDNANVTLKDEIEDRAQRHGSVTIHLGFGRQASKKWRAPSPNMPRMEIHEAPHGERNAADITLAAYAAKLACTTDVTVFAIASGDFDFSGLALWLREEGKTVIGIGEARTTSGAFRGACTHFEALKAPAPKPTKTQKTAKKKAERSGTTHQKPDPSRLGRFLEFLRGTVQQSGNHNEWRRVTRLGPKLIARNPTIRWAEYGHRRLRGLVAMLARAFPDQVEIDGTGTALRVRLR